MKPSLTAQSFIIALLLALGSFVTFRYGFDAVAKQALLESAFYQRRPQIARSPDPILRPSATRMLGTNL